MTTVPSTDDRALPSETMKTLAFTILIVGASLGFSRALACATPFAALATVAGVRLPWRPAFAAVLLAWGANQAIGFGLLHYPHTATTLAWGIAIGLADATAAAVASALSPWTTARGLVGAVWRTAIVLAAAYAAYEGVLLAATLVLPSTHAAFAPVIVARIFGINLVACALLLALQHGAERLGLAPPLQQVRPLEG